MRYAPASLLALSLVAASTSCSSRDGGDPHSDLGAPAIGGKDMRVRELTDPTLPGHETLPNTTQSVSGLVVIAIDTFDETLDGKNAGGILLQDLDASKDRPYGGINLFAPSFNPGNLKVSPGDVLDLRGQYQENAGIPSKPPLFFAPGAVLPQLSQPIATFRYETRVPDPIDIDVADLSDFTKGRKWLGMLVRVKNLTAARDTYDPGNGRTSLDLATVSSTDSSCAGPFPKPPQLTNDLMDLRPYGFKTGSKIASVVGVVGFFCNIHLVPRSPADIQL